MADSWSPLFTALAAAFGAGGVGIVVATGASWQRLRASVLTQRYCTWLALALLYVPAALVGAPGAALLATMLAVQSAREAAPLLGLNSLYGWALIVLCAALPLLTLLELDGWGAGLVLLVALALPIARGRVEELDNTMRLAFGALLLGWTLAQLVALAQAGSGWLVLALFGTAVSDVCAFTLGALLRGPLLAPRLSPSKTWAGLLGNLLGALGALLLVLPLLPPLSPVAAALLVAALGLGGCVGDLAESLLKRHAGVKDAGRWLPGFGGLLDRVDSLLVAAPLVAAVATYFAQGGV